MNRITAPDNFVPLSPLVVLPDWAPAVSQDMPFQDGICGELDVVIRANTPILTRRPGTKREDAQTFFQHPDGTVAIPGSTVKGMLRSTVEVAAFGRLRQVNDHTYGFRDLTRGNRYVEHMSRTGQALSGKSDTIPLVGAAWLAQKGGEWTITPCSYAKIEYKILMSLARKRGLQNFAPGRERTTSPAKYQAWTASREVRVKVEKVREEISGGARGWFGKVTEVSDDAPLKGTLVFTGQPNTWVEGDTRPARPGAGHPKHHDFVFVEGPVGSTMQVPPEVQRAFQFVHSGGKQQHRVEEDPNEEWGYQKERLARNERVPVFYLLEKDGKTPRALGLAQMFRLAYKFSTLDAVRNAQPEPDAVSTEAQRSDLADLLFGFVPLLKGRRGADAEERAEHGGLRGRVSCSPFKLHTKKVELPARTVVLGAPKASYFPNYVEQNPRNGPGGRPPPDSRANAFQPVTYMDDGVKARGWKRYRAQERIVEPPPPATTTGKVASMERTGTTFRPLEAGSEFRGCIRLHNARPAEVGALLWALDFGGSATARHTLGLARSLGYGNVRVTADDTPAGNRLTRVVDDTRADLDICRKAFIAYMEAQCSKAGVPGGWSGSRQIHELLAIAQPILAGSDEGHHMRLDHPTHRDQFKMGKALGLSLTPAGATTWLAPAAPAQRAGVQAGSVAAQPIGGPFGGATAFAVTGSGAAMVADQLVAAIRTLPGHKLPGQFAQLVARARALPEADRKRVAEALLAQAEKVWADGKKNPLYKEVKGWG